MKNKIKIRINNKIKKSFKKIYVLMKKFLYKN